MINARREAERLPRTEPGRLIGDTMYDPEQRLKDFEGELRRTVRQAERVAVRTTDPDGWRRALLVIASRSRGVLLRHGVEVPDPF